MKRYFFMIFVLLIGFSGYAQNNKRSGHIIYLNESLRDDSRVADAMNFRRVMNIREVEIIPIGWSNNGIFAYFKENFNYMAGGPTDRVDLIIFNAIDDEIEEIVKIRASTWDDDWAVVFKKEDVETGNQTLEKYRINKRIDRIPTKFGFEFDQFPFYWNTRKYDCWFEAIVDEEIDEYNDPIYTIKWNLIASNNNKQKIIASGTETSSGGYGMGGGYIGSRVIGYIKNPYENRILVEIEHLGAGFEGDICSSVEYHGCHLDIGYK